VFTWHNSAVRLALPNFLSCVHQCSGRVIKMCHAAHDDLDRRLAEARTKSAYKPDPSQREQAIQRASVPEGKRKAAQSLPPPKPLPSMTCCPACGSDKYHFELGIDFHVCEKCGNRFF
jgi:hypothetical protein